MQKIHDQKKKTAQAQAKRKNSGYNATDEFGGG
jgi:hypothetical protein